jgi:Protein of unknown function (DUF3037)
VLELSSFDYAVLRVTPRVDREEFINAGVILFCLQRKYLAARVHLDESRLRALWPGVDIDLIRRHLEAFPKISAGTDDSGPIGKLPQRQRFHWLVAPRSTIIQVSPVHTGLCDDPDRVLAGLFERLVLLS